MPEAFICGAPRTPIGRYAGVLSSVRPDDLAARVLRALLARNPGLPAEAALPGRRGRPGARPTAS